ncbi:MAG: hypothetical protein LM632_12180, partial [Armatimonadetes bacterium]|nr:hypothetical protein [Armatimonadota bacterium]
WGLPNTNLPPLVTMALGVLVPLVSARFVMRWSGNGHRWSDTHRIALAFGALSFFIALAPLQEHSNPTRPDNTAGMSLVGLVALIGLVWQWRRLVRWRGSSQGVLPSV